MIMFHVNLQGCKQSFSFKGFVWDSRSDLVTETLRIPATVVQEQRPGPCRVFLNGWSGPGLEEAVMIPGGKFEAVIAFKKCLVGGFNPSEKY